MTMDGELSNNRGVYDFRVFEKSAGKAGEIGTTASQARRMKVSKLSDTLKVSDSYGNTKMNFKQKELVETFFQAVKAEFPEVELIDVTESPEDPNDLWVNVKAPEDEGREIEMIELAGHKSTDVLLDYGYSILIMPRHSYRQQAAA